MLGWKQATILCCWPLVGIFGPEALKLLCEIGHYFTLEAGKPRHFLQMLSVAMQMDNAAGVLGTITDNHNDYKEYKFINFMFAQDCVFHFYCLHIVTVFAIGLLLIKLNCDVTMTDTSIYVYNSVSVFVCSRFTPKLHQE